MIRRLKEDALDLEAIELSCSVVVATKVGGRLQIRRVSPTLVALLGMQPGGWVDDHVPQEDKGAHSAGVANPSGRNGYLDRQHRKTALCANGDRKEILLRVHSPKLGRYVAEIEPA